jgi:multidrug resistance efflux pump
MKTRTLTFGLIILISGLLLVACGGAGGSPADAQATEVPITVADTAVVAEGRLVPNEYVDLSFTSAGQVAEILVEEGDVVAKGDVLVRLGDREQFESAVAGAELELQAAQEERLAADKALETLTDDLPQAQTQALEAVKNARQILNDARRRYDSLISTADQTDLDAAQAQLVLAREALEDAEKDYKPYENKAEDNVVRATFLARLAAARQVFDDAARQVNRLEGLIGSDFDISQAESELEVAQNRLDQAMEDLETLRAGPDPDQVVLAESRVQTAEDRILAAETGLASAQAALDDLDLVATIDGTVVKQDLIEGEQVSPGVPAVQLADFTQWYAETDNLTEIDVVNVSVGQGATVVPDALPDLELTGTVESIDDFFEEKRGDVTYTARILLNESDPRLRWGMTVVMTFEE